MDKARCNGKELKIHDNEADKANGKLSCFYCNAEVVYVRTHKRNLGEREITVSRHFRLKRGEQHEEGCRYTVDGAVKYIYSDCADNEIMSKQDHYYIVRLMDILGDDHKINHHIETIDSPIHRNTRRNYIPKGKKSKYLSTMNQIMELRSRVENNSELEDTIRLQYYDSFGNPKTVSWNQFYYDSDAPNDYRNLFQNLKQKKIDHRICVAGIIDTVSEVTQIEKFCIKLRSVPGDGIDYISLSIYFKDGQLYEQLKDKESHKVIVFASFNLGKENIWPKGSSAKRIYHNIAGNINDPKEILLLPK